MRETVDAATRTDGKDSSKRGALAGDSSVTGLQTSLRMLAAGAGVNIAGAFSTLGQVGISFGAVGSALGSTNNLQLDETKFKAALVSDPVSVQAVFSQYKLGSTLVPGGTGSIASMTGTYTGAKAGSYVITDDGAGNLSSLFTPQDGSTPVTTTAIVTASGTNTTLVPGMTLQIGGALTAGTNTITVAPTSSSVMNRLKDFLEGQVGVSGSFTQRAAIYDRRTKDIAARQVQIQAGIDAEMSVLRKKFAAMEQAQARAQSAMSQIQSAMAKTTSN
jgi:flagellar hook-associated protein 2